MDDLSTFFNKMFYSLTVVHGYEMPIHFSSIASNGYIMSGKLLESNKYDSGYDLEWLFDSELPEGLQLPINMMFVEGNGGRAIRVLIDNKGEVTTLH